MSRQELADAVNAYLAGTNDPDGPVTANHVGKLEQGTNTWPRALRRQAYRAILGATTDAELGFYNIRRRPTDRLAGLSDDRNSTSPVGSAADVSNTSSSLFVTIAAPPGRDSHGPSVTMPPSLLAPQTLAARVHGGNSQFHLWAPAGTFFPGLDLHAQVHRATDDREIQVHLPEDYRLDPFLQQLRRGLVIGQTSPADESRLYGLDSRYARGRLGRTAAGAPLPIPRAYLLDDLTLALLWAVVSLDEALLADDAVLEQAQHGLTTYQRLGRSTGSRDLAGDLTATGSRWLGSAFCAGHIRRHATALAAAPVFWTREQRGEEASTWLLFRHKNEYLHATAHRAAGENGLVRVFCLPRSAVETSPPGERALLLLAAALMESYGITVAVTGEPSYTALTGFVSDRRRRAIVAEWVGADDIWHVDVIEHRPTIRQYTDATNHAISASVVGAPTSEGRLRALAEYLELDWPWIVERCRELGEYGLAGLVLPRSRHLSVDGVDRACRHVAQYARVAA
jgi:hypothetical protein